MEIFFEAFTNNLGSAMLHTTSDNMECGMWNVECGMMYKREVMIDM
jgi:hypothetical protein